MTGGLDAARFVIAIRHKHFEFLKARFSHLYRADVLAMVDT